MAGGGELDVLEAVPVCLLVEELPPEEPVDAVAMSPCRHVASEASGLRAAGVALTSTKPWAAPFTRGLERMKGGRGQSP